MHNKMKRVVSFTMACILSATLAACGGNDSAQTSTTEGATDTSAAVATETVAEPVTISIFAKNVGGQGVKLGEQNDPIAKEIEKKLGIKISIYKDGSDQTLNQVLGTMLASNDLADIQFLAEEKNLQSCIKGDMILPLDEMLEKNAPNIMNTPDLKLRVDYSREKYAVDGKIYNINLWGGTGLDATPVAGPYIRWDLYKKLNYPAINTQDDLINVLSEMQKLEPQTKDGQKVYAVGGFFADGAGWGDWPLMNTFVWSRGYANVHPTVFVDVSTSTVMPNQLTDPNSVYWQTVSFYYKAQKAGLMDPDAATQKYDKFQEKAKAGRYLFVPTGWDARGLKDELAKTGNPDAGFICLPPAETDPGVAMGWSGYLSNQFYAISKNCKNPEAAMKLIDFVSSQEGARLMHSGVEGMAWKMVDGKPSWTEEYLNDAKTLDTNGMKEKYGTEKYKFFSGYQLNVVSEKDGEIFDLNQSKAYMEGKYNAAEKDAIAHYGAKSLTNINLKPGKPFVYITEYTTWPDKSAEIKAIDTNVTNYIYGNIFKSVFAKDDNDFAAKQKAFIDGLGKYKVDVLYQWYLDNYNKNKAELGPQIEPLVKEFEAKVAGN